MKWEWRDVANKWKKVCSWRGQLHYLCSWWKINIPLLWLLDLCCWYAVQDCESRTIGSGYHFRPHKSNALSHHQLVGTCISDVNISPIHHSFPDVYHWTIAHCYYTTLPYHILDMLGYTDMILVPVIGPSQLYSERTLQGLDNFTHPPPYSIWSQLFWIWD